MVVMTAYGNEHPADFEDFQSQEMSRVMNDMNGISGRYQVFAAKGHIPGGSSVQ